MTSLSSSLSVSPKSGKSSKSAKASSLSYSSKSGKAEIETECEPCAYGDAFGSPCGTDVGFCEFDFSGLGPPVCSGKACTPDCFYLEPYCETCLFGTFFGFDCPTDQGPFCEIVLSVDAAPTCVPSDCFEPPPDAENICGLCSTGGQFGCPNVPGFCEVDFFDQCTRCTDTECPTLSLDQCDDEGPPCGPCLDPDFSGPFVECPAVEGDCVIIYQPGPVCETTDTCEAPVPAGATWLGMSKEGGRRLGMGHEKWGFKHGQDFKFEFGLGL